MGGRGVAVLRGRKKGGTYWLIPMESRPGARYPLTRSISSIHVGGSMGVVRPIHLLAS